MLISDFVLVTVNSSNKYHYLNLGYDVKNKDIIKVPIKDLTKGSGVRVEVECDVCHNRKYISYKRYLENISNHNIFCCSRKCANIKRELTCQERYGVNHISSLDEIKIKVKEKTKDKLETSKKKREDTCLERYGTKYPQKLEEFKEKTRKTCENKYGVSNYTQTEDYKEKTNKTNQNRYGCEWFMETDEFREKSKQTNLGKYGVEYPSQSEEVKSKNKEIFLNKYGVESYTKTKEYLEKSKQTCLEKYGVENQSQNKVVKEKSLKTRLSNRLIELEDYGLVGVDYKNHLYTMKCDCGKDHTFEINYDTFKNRKIYGIKLCTVCNDYTIYSGKEKNLLNFISENYVGEIILNSRKIIKPYELDIYLPDLKVAFEYNGLYWHNSKKKHPLYHKKKHDMCHQKGIKLFMIWEDDWEDKTDIVKSNILRLLGKSKNIKNELIQEICEEQSFQFLNLNHLKGQIKADVYIGSFIQNELISVACFNGNNLIRLCDKIGYKTHFQKFLNQYSLYDYINYDIDLDFNEIEDVVYEILSVEEPILMIRKNFEIYNSGIMKVKVMKN